MGWREDLAAQVSTAKTFGSGNYFTSGKYKLRSSLLKMHDGENGKSFIAEFLVTDAQATEAGVEPNMVGSTASVAYNLTKIKSAAGDVKALALAFMGMTEEQLIAAQQAEDQKAAAEGRASSNLFVQWLLKVTNESASAGTVQPLRGRLVGGETYRKATKKHKETNAPRSEWMTLMKFSHIPETPAELEAGRKLVEANEPAPAAPVAPADPTPPATTAAPAPSLLDGII